MYVTTMTEDIYLQQLIASGESVSCFLASGIRLLGVVRSHHGEAIFMEPHADSRGGLIMIFKTQISSIMPTPKKSTRSSVDQRHGMLADNSVTPNG